MTTARARTSRLLTLALGVMLVVGPTGALARQPLPNGIEAKPALNQADRDAITRFVGEQKAKLSGEPDAIKSGRDNLLARLASRGVTVEFRQVMAGALVDDLRRLAADQRDIVAVNALRVAGELATSTSVSIAIDGLKDPRSPVAYAATFALARAFEAARANPAINPADLNRAVGAAADFLSRQTDAHLADGATLALCAACRIEGPAGFPDSALVALAKAAGARAQTIGAAGVDSAAMLAVVTRAAVSLRDAALPGRAIAPATRTAAATLAGELLVAVERAAKAQGAPSPATFAPEAQLGETLLCLIAERQAIGLGQRLQSGDLPGFSKLLDEQVLSDAGILKSLGIDPKQFKR